jgi:ubiquinone/menaquinone biosynthesis C-methylase UbiE
MESDYYSRIAGGYDELYGPEQAEKLGIISKYISNTERMLDVGAGSGISLKFFPDIILLDPSFALLKKAGGKRICCVAEHLPIKDNSIKGIISVTALHHTDIDIVISEFKRVMTPDASMAITLLKCSTNIGSMMQKLIGNFRLKKIDCGKDILLLKHIK